MEKLAALLTKYRRTSISAEELREMTHLLDKLADSTDHPPGERIAAHLFLAALKSREASHVNR